LTLTREDLDLEQELHSKLLEVIVAESGRLADIVDDLLLASQLDAGTLDLQIERCDVRELTDAVIDAARTHLPENVTVDLEAPADDLPAVAADAGELRQVLANLVDNAIKYSPDGGAIRVRLEPGEAHVRFEVADEGLGVPPAEQARIFEKFYRLDPHMTRGIGGTGLGLYISREIVKRVKGRIWVEPNGDRGSVFYVEIPIAPPPVDGGQRREAAEAHA
jgi:two-component system sensor histidine kinase VicK